MTSTRVLRWGTGVLAVQATCMPGFLAIRFTNLVASSLKEVQVSLISGGVVTFMSRPPSLDIPPLEEARAILPYHAPVDSPVVIVALFSFEGEVLFLKEEVTLLKCSPDTWEQGPAWEPVVPHCQEVRTTLPENLAPTEVPAMLQPQFRLPLFLVKGLGASLAGEWAWGCLDPVAIIAFSPPRSLRLIAPSGHFLSQVKDFLRQWAPPGASYSKAIELGHAVAAIKNFVELCWKATDTLAEARKIQRLLQDLGLLATWPVPAIEKLLAGKETLRDLSKGELSQLDHIIDTLEQNLLLY